jgi:hypothetical protein
VCLLEAYCLGVSRDKAKLTVLIGSTSRKRDAQLEKTLKRSGVLKTAAVPFQVVIRDPKNKMDAWLSNITCTLLLYLARGQSSMF